MIFGPKSAKPFDVGFFKAELTGGFDRKLVTWRTIDFCLT